MRADAGGTLLDLQLIQWRAWYRYMEDCTTERRRNCEACRRRLSNTVFQHTTSLRDKNSIV